ncbi:MAG: 4-hydroxythreonine-4-phosphate dehydrogenase PdxA [Pseudomonadota bacterium]
MTGDTADQSAKRPLTIGLTLGDPAGVGPELATILFKGITETTPYRLVAFGPLSSIAPYRLPDEQLIPITVQELARLDPIDNQIFGVDCLSPAPIVPGQPDEAHGAAVVQSLKTAAYAARKGMVDALVTLPIAKSTAYAAGFQFPGQTEFFADACSVAAKDTVMMLASDTLRVVPVTIHVPLVDVPATLSANLIVERGLTTFRALRQDFGIENPRLVAAGLNPHAGENGAIGREEIEVIMPALETLRRQGVSIEGPFAADSLFHSDARSAYDAALCMYHDQALIPLKTLDFHGGVNITLGLPIVRTSPDHGTAFDIAGTGKADPRSSREALKMAISIANRRQPSSI